MKATRGTCLRCGEPLSPQAAGAATAADPPSARTPSRSTILVGSTASIVIAGLIAFTWLPGSVNDPAQPVVGAASPIASSSTQTGQTVGINSASSPTYEPVTFMDSTRAGGASFASGDFESARAAYEQALAKHPDDPAALNNLGQALMRLERVDEAIVHFERAVDLAPKTWAYRFNLAAAEAKRGRWDRAVDHYAEAVRAFPDDYASQYNLALALHKNGDEPAAIRAYEQAIQLAPGEATFHVSLGVSLEKIGRVADAVREYRVFLEMEPLSPDAAKLKAHVDALVMSTTAQGR